MPLNGPGMTTAAAQTSAATPMRPESPTTPAQAMSEDRDPTAAQAPRLPSPVPFVAAFPDAAPPHKAPAVPCVPGPPGKAKHRLEPIDLVRGTACVAMLLTHLHGKLDAQPLNTEYAYYEGHGTDVVWWVALLHNTASDLPIPTFALCMGMGMELMVAPRVAAGAPRADLVQSFWQRGLLLVALDVGRSLLQHPPHVHIMQSALAALGASMCLVGTALPLMCDQETGQPSRAQQLLLAFAGVAALVGTHAVALWAQGGQLELGADWPSISGSPSTVWQVLLRVFVLPGRVTPHYSTYFTIVPYTGMALLGAAVAPEVSRDPAAGWRTLGVAGAALLGLFVVARFAGGPWVNLRGPTRLEHGSLVCRYLCLSKLPPSLAYDLLFLGAAGAAMYGFSCALPNWCRGAEERQARDAGKAPVLYACHRAGDEVLNALLDYGSAPLFFYLAQTFAIQGLSYVPILRHRPTHIVVPALAVPLLWGLRLACHEFAAFKRVQPRNSCWRMF